MYQVDNTLVTQSELLNKLSEKAGLDERVETTREINPEKRELFDKLNRYKAPLMSKSEYSSYMIQQLNRLSAMSNRQRDFCQRNRLPYTDNSYMMKHYQSSLIKTDTNVTYGLDLVSLQWTVILPFQGEIKLEDFEQCLEYIPSLTGKQTRISMTSSVPAILDLCQARGFTLKNLCELLALLIKKYIPASEPLVNTISSEHPEDYVTLITNNINPQKDLEAIDKLIDQVSRAPSETISEVVEKSKSLYIHRMRLNNSKLSREELEIKAERSVIVYLSGWVTPQCWEKVSKWKNDRERAGAILYLSQYLDQIILNERREKFRPTSALKSNTNLDHSTLASVAQVQQQESDDHSDYATDENEDADEEDDDMDVNFVRKAPGFPRNRGRGRGRSGNASGNSSRRSASTPNPRQSRNRQRQQHPRRRSYSRKYQRTSSYPPKRFYRSPGGTFRNTSTNTSHGRSPSVASTNTSTTSSQRREYLSKSSYNIVAENHKRCLRCDGNHLSRACPRFSSYCKNICPFCVKKRGKSLYHAQELCPFRGQIGRSTNYVEPSPHTLEKRYHKKLNRASSFNRPKSDRFKSPVNDFVKTQYNSSLHARQGNDRRGKR